MAENVRQTAEHKSPDGRYRARFWQGEKGIVFCEAAGYEDFESSKKVVEILRDYRRISGKRISVCLDASRYTGLAPESRQYMRERLLLDDSFLARFAVVGGNLLTRNLFNMYSKIANIPMKVFKTRNEAVAWLTEA